MKKARWLILVAFLFGILLANLWGTDFLMNYGVLNAYYMSQYANLHANLSVDTAGLFCRVLLERCKAGIVIVVLGKLIDAKWLFVDVWSVLSFALGVFMTAAITGFGIRGIVIALGSMLPQWLCYFAALWIFLKCRIAGARENATYHGGKSGFHIENAQIGIYLLVLLLLFAGIACESYVNPAILKVLWGII